MSGKKRTEISTIDKSKSADSIALISPEDLKTQISVETAKRKLINNFIANHLKEGTDYGKIHVYKTCPNHKTPWQCTNKYHFSKNTLFKPGAEKFSSLFKMRSGFQRDQDTWEMLGSPAGTVCYVCNLFTAKDVLIGEGRGAASVAEKGNPNTAIKIAKKRAFVDAVLSTGALSDFFTQDLEDMKDLEPEADDVPTINVEEPESASVEKRAISGKTRIAHLCKLLGIELDVFAEDEIKNLTHLEVVEKNYEEIIKRMEMVLQDRKELAKEK